MSTLVELLGQALWTIAECVILQLILPWILAGLPVFGAILIYELDLL